MTFRFTILSVLSLLLGIAAMAQTSPTGADMLPTSINLTSSKGYLIGPGDVITVKVLGEKDFDFAAVVDEDGRIEVPFSETPIMAKCRTEREVGAEVRKAIQKYVKEPNVNFAVTERNSRPPAVIWGEVNTPHEVVIKWGAKPTLAYMLAAAQGAREGSSGLVQVFRTKSPVCEEDIEGNTWQVDPKNPASEVPSRMFSIAEMNKGGENNPRIYPGDIVFVLKAAPIYINGEVVEPKGIWLTEQGLSLTEAIARAGGPRAEAKTKDVHIYRVKAGGSPTDRDREQLTANLELIKLKQQSDPMLQPNDIIVVDRTKDSLGVTMLKFAIGIGKTAATAASTGGGYRISTP
jgi:polysaccharide export outer membrane protein